MGQGCPKGNGTQKPASNVAKSPMKLVKAHGNEKLVKEPRKLKESQWAKDA